MGEIKILGTDAKNVHRAYCVTEFDFWNIIPASQRKEKQKKQKKEEGMENKDKETVNYCKKI